MSRVLEDYEGRAVILQNGIRVDARVTYRAEENRVIGRPGFSLPGMKHWAGTFQPEIARPFGPATLELSDGRKGHILIVGVDTIEVTAMGEDWCRLAPLARGSFIGTGAAPYLWDEQ